MPSPESFEDLRPYLFGIAYRMLGTVTDAEDLVQEAYVRWSGVAEEVRSARAFLTTTVTRLCIDHLRSARVQRESYVGPWLPEPVITEGLEPEGKAALAETVSMAFLVLLESLNPVERAVFLLRDVFDYDYPEIATIVLKEEANCRQIHRRALSRIEARRPRFNTSRQEQERLVAQFTRACEAGDLAALEGILARDVTSWADGGGVSPAARNPVQGRNNVARYFIGIAQKFQQGRTTHLVEVNGEPAVIVLLHGRPRSLVVPEFADGLIHALRVIVNPAKLKGLVEMGK
jgi:RNA polymerase sigma-70 factor, ECF subfamily